MKKIKFYVCLMFSFMLCFSSCDDEFKDETFVVYDVQPASTYLSKRSEDFSEWIKIMKYADLYNAVNQATQGFTLFVPNNKAVTEFYQHKNVSSIEELGEEYAKTLVRYHVINDSITQETFISTEGQIEQPTLSEDYLSVSFGTNENGIGGLQSIYLNKEAHVIELANKVTNGYVYVLENVMTPLTESVYERVAEKSEYSIFKNILDKTGLGTHIHTMYEETTDANGNATLQKRNYTVLAVTDEIYHAEGITDVASLAAKLGETSDAYSDSENEVYKYVAYHLISGNYSLAKLQSFDAEGNTSKLWNTLSGGNLIKISKEENDFYLNYYDKENRCRFNEDNCDIQAKNGYIHQISKYMPVAEPEPETVLFDLCNFEEIANYIAAGKGDANCKYQELSPTTSAEGWADLTSLSIFQYKATTPSKWNKNAPLMYMNAKSNNDWKEANNHDYLVFDIGYMGWFSVQTPTILKGKYKITIQFGHAGSLDFIAKQSSEGSGKPTSDGGQMEISIDNESVTNYPYASDHKTGSSYNFTYTLKNTGSSNEDKIWDFDTTSKHTFKITLKDPAASNSSKYRMYIDYILFEPVIED